MSTETHPLIEAPTGFPELTELGKRIEVLRIHRGLSKQQLARDAGTSRQQLWRVATGKSELTSSLRQRIADVLQVDGALLRQRPPASPGFGEASMGEAPTPAGVPSRRSAGPFGHADGATRQGGELGAYVADTDRIARTLATLPAGADGRRLKRALLDAIEDLAIEQKLPLGPRVFELRRRVVAGEL